MNDVPFVDLKSQYNSVRNEVGEALDRILAKQSFILGEEVELFEQEFAKYCQARFCVAVNSGTSALHLALLAHGVGAGDEVITVPNTFIATAEAISYTGATPVFVDIDPQTYNMDATKIEAAITSKTKAILPVHLFGQPADMDAILAIAQSRGLIVIEDACQSHGAEYKGRKTGSLGNAGCFSFYPSKVMGAYGEGGAIVCHDEAVYQKVRAWRDHGQVEKHHHQSIGYNYRMEAIQGAVLRVKLRYADQWIEARRQKANSYSQLLEGSPFTSPFEADYARGVYYVYVIRTKSRDKVQAHLLQNGIQTGIHYPIPIHLQGAYKYLGLKEGSFPIAERYAGEILSLPLYPELSEENISYVTDVLKAIP
jgi:dTDP-4-amino-4,6-dideoxygalactose transaminase